MQDVRQDMRYRVSRVVGLHARLWSYELWNGALFAAYLIPATLYLLAVGLPVLALSLTVLGAFSLASGFIMLVVLWVTGYLGVLCALIAKVVLGVPAQIMGARLKHRLSVLPVLHELNGRRMTPRTAVNRVSRLKRSAKVHTSPLYWG